MIHIILRTIKIIGILLLCVLGILLLFLLLVLFVPLRYRVKGEKQEEPDRLYLGAKVSWLLHVITVSFRYEKEMICKVRVFGIVVYDYARREEYARRKARREEKRAAGQQRKAGRRSAGKKQDLEPVKAPENRQSVKSESVKSESAQSGTGPEENNPGKEQSADTGRQAFCKKAAAFYRMLTGLFQNIRYTIRRICDKIKQIAEEIEYYKNVLEKEESRRAFHCAGKQLAAVWKNIRPAKLKVFLTVGFDDPAATGQLVSVYSMFYPWIRHTITLEPDFERAVLKGNLFCKGRVTIFILLRTAWILYFNRDIRAFLRLWKKEETENG